MLCLCTSVKCETNDFKCVRFVWQMIASLRASFPTSQQCVIKWYFECNNRIRCIDIFKFRYETRVVLQKKIYASDIINWSLSIVPSYIYQRSTIKKKSYHKRHNKTNGHGRIWSTQRHSTIWRAKTPNSKTNTPDNKRNAPKTRTQTKRTHPSTNRLCKYHIDKNKRST